MFATVDVSNCTDLLVLVNEVKVFEGGAPLGPLRRTGLALVGGAFEVVLLVVDHRGRQQVVHHQDTNVGASTLEKRRRKGGKEGGREEGRERGREGERERGREGEGGTR